MSGSSCDEMIIKQYLILCQELVHTRCSLVGCSIFVMNIEKFDKKFHANLEPICNPKLSYSHIIRLLL